MFIKRGDDKLIFILWIEKKECTSHISKKKRKQTKEVVETIEKRQRSRAKNLRKKVQKIKKETSRWEVNFSETNTINKTKVKSF